jgi:hypothetical protein
VSDLEISTLRRPRPDFGCCAAKKKKKKKKKKQKKKKKKNRKKAGKTGEKK